jgi:hypothetical protein
VFERQGQTSNAPTGRGRGRARGSRLDDQPVAEEVAGVIVDTTGSDGTNENLQHAAFGLEYRPQVPPGEREGGRARGRFVKISYLDARCAPLQYPLLLPHGTEGWMPGNPHAHGTKTVSMMVHWGYRCLFKRPHEGYSLTNGVRLLLQFMVVA